MAEDRENTNETAEAAEVAAPAGPDLARLERLVSLTAAGLGLAAMAIAILVSSDHKASAVIPLALIGGLVLGKVVVLGLALRSKWPQWPAVVLEIGALATVGWVVYAGAASVTPVLVIAVLLAAAALWRRRVTQRDG